MRKILVLLIGLSTISFPTFGQEKVNWIVMARLGSAYNFKAPLIIKQDGFPDIKLNAKYATHGLYGPPYYEFNVVRWKETRGWGLKVTHHKLYLLTKHPDIQRFTITDGYNLLTLVREWKLGLFIYHIGAGIVLTHPESIIRGHRFSEVKGLLGSGYHFSGPVAEAAIEKRFTLSKHFILSFEGKIAGSYVKVPVAFGHARTSNISLHGMGGIAYSFGK